MANLFILIVSPCALAKKWLFWFYSRIICFYGVRECFAFEKGRLMCRAKPNVPLAGWLKLFLKNVRWEKLKHRRVGNECRLTRCPFVISFLCLWSPLKMVYFFLFLSVVCLSCRCLNTLTANARL